MSTSLQLLDNAVCFTAERALTLGDGMIVIGLVMAKVPWMVMM